MLHRCVCVYTYTYMCVCVCVFMCVYIIYMYAHGYMHAYIHTLHYKALHYIALYYITRHYVTLRYITLHHINHISIHYIYIHTYVEIGRTRNIVISMVAAPVMRLAFLHFACCCSLPKPWENALFTAKRLKQKCQKPDYEHKLS